MNRNASFLVHVNGLRAIAILGIVLYHLNAAYCPTGYFGVDVFLVISGYFLLASLMTAEVPGEVHYGSFLLKKAWRIIPSWFIVTCVFYFGCAWFMIPEDRLEICNTACRSAFFAADFYIDSRYDYFNQNAHQNLFLHYWYLSITCQVYILVPLVVMLLRFCSRKAATIAAGLIGVLSLCLYVLTCTPQVPVEIRQAFLAGTGMKTAYYHLLPRLWEILAGGAVLLLPVWQEKTRLRKLLGTVGMVGIVSSFYLYATGSPQVYLAVVSTMLFIRYGGEGWVSRLLSWRPIQWLGTISFSLYLWHWPIMAAWKYVKLGEITWCDELSMLLLSIMFGVMAWRWIESLKMPKSSSRLMLCMRCLPILMMLFFAVGTRPYYKGVRSSVQSGLKGKGLLPEMVAEIMSQPQDEELVKGFLSRVHKDVPAYIGTNGEVAPSFLLIGDSHSTHSFHGLHRYCREHGIRGIFYNNTVIPFWGCYWSYKDNSSYWDETKAEALMEYLNQHPNIKCVFAALLWQTRLYGSPAEVGGETMDWREMRILSHEEQNAIREDGLREMCRRIAETGRRVILLEDVPKLPANITPYRLAEKVKLLRGEEPPEYLVPVHLHKKASGYAEFFRRLVDEGVVWASIDCAEALRRGDFYRTRNDEGEYLYSDGNHLTYAGSELVGSYIMQEWERMVREDEEAESAAAAPEPAAP